MEPKAEGEGNPRPAGEDTSSPVDNSQENGAGSGNTPEDANQAHPPEPGKEGRQPRVRPAEGSVARNALEAEESATEPYDAYGEALDDTAREPAASESPKENLPNDQHKADYDYDYDSPYEYGESTSFHDEPPEPEPAAAAPEQPGGALAAPPAPPPPPAVRDEEDDDDDDEGMLRMSFMDHLEELRSRIIKALMGVGLAFIVCVVFSNDLWRFASAPAEEALRNIGAQNTHLIAIKPTEQFNVLWLKLPLVASIFLSAPWLLYQVWAFIAPGLYKRERRWAAPFVIVSAGLFILGGAFAYFVAFRFGLTFLLGIGRDIDITPLVTIEEYFDLFVNVVVVIGLVFELPVLIFFLTLLRILSPRFLLANTRYAVLGIVVLAAIVTPTPDVFNLMIFSVPMLLLYFIGVFASYLLVLQRENRRFPWFKVVLVLGILVIAAVIALTLAVSIFGYELVSHWPFLIR